MIAYGVSRSPHIILFGAGQRNALTAIVRSYGTRAFICSDSRFRQDPALTGLADDMTATGITVEVYDATIAELPLSCILEATDKARSFQPDVIIGLGGGSCLDIAKLVASSTGASWTVVRVLRRVPCARTRDAADRHSYHRRYRV